uniref:Leucine rich immune protein (Coil-less) n=1 Tax=Anopheles melas TaxID=34690 RepID=A0A182TX41_9DIPT
MVPLKANSRVIIYSSTLVLLVFLQQVYTFCPSICTCEGDPNVRTWCIGAGLDVVPIQLNPDVRYINLTANRITNVHFTLTFYYKLEVLDLAGNRIEALGSRNFDTQQALRTLNLSDNAIVSIPKDAFRGLQRLQTLKLCGNRIDTIHPAAFHDLRNLIELDLEGNALTSLEPSTLRHLYSLEVLSFQNNQLLEVPYERNLEHLGQRLQLLDLSVNLLEYIANDSFVALRELRTLRLGGNILTELDYGAFHGLSGLKALDIVDNNLTCCHPDPIRALWMLMMMMMMLSAKGGPGNLHPEPGQHYPVCASVPAAQENRNNTFAAKVIASHRLAGASKG